MTLDTMEAATPTLLSNEKLRTEVERLARHRNAGSIYFALVRAGNLEDSDESAARVLQIYLGLVLKGAI
jgi:hypothetical protein